MSKQERATGVQAGQVSEVQAEVGRADEWVQMHHPTLGAFQVPTDQVPAWMGQGFRLRDVDFPAAVTEVHSLFDAARATIQPAVDGITADGYIDTADDAAIMTVGGAMRLLNEAVDRLLTDLQTAYPVRQAEPVMLVQTIDVPGADGPYRLEQAVDPAQVDAFLKHPTEQWARARGTKKADDKEG